MRTLYLLSGMPGSGKSTWAKLFQSSHPQAKIVSSDQIRVDLFGSRKCFDAEEKVWAIFLDELQRYASSPEAEVIADATNLTNYYRLYYRKNTPGYDHHVLVVFDIPYALAKERNAARPESQVVPLSAMDSLEREWEEPSREVLSQYDETIHVGADFLQKGILF